MTRACGKVATNQDSYKRAYRDVDTYDYPKIVENPLQRKREEYFLQGTRNYQR